MRKLKAITAGPIAKKEDGSIDFGISMVLSDLLVMEGREQDFQLNLLLNTEMRADLVVKSLRMFADHIEEEVVNEPKVKMTLVNKG